MKPGWQTTENAQTAGGSIGIMGLAAYALEQPDLSLSKAIVLAAVAIGVSVSTIMYTRARTVAKAGS
jgi:hypothetical protein